MEDEQDNKESVIIQDQLPELEACPKEEGKVRNHNCHILDEGRGDMDIRKLRCLLIMSKSSASVP